MPANDEDKKLMFFNFGERNIFERFRDWWKRGGRNVLPLLYTGSGDPNTVVTAVVGSLFLRTNGGTGTTLYVKESGSAATGWIAK